MNHLTPLAPGCGALGDLGAMLGASSEHGHLLEPREQKKLLAGGRESGRVASGRKALLGNLVSG